MKAAFLVPTAYALLGVLYAPTLNSLVAFFFIACWCAPFVLADVFVKDIPLSHRPPSFPLFWTCIALGIANLAVIAAKLEVGLGDLLSVENLVSAAALATVLRYEEKGSSGNPILLAVSLFLLYRIGAAAFEVSGKKKLLAFAPAVLYSIISTEKWPMFLGATFFLTGMFVAHPFRQAWRRAAIYVACFAILGGVLAAIALFLRGVEGEGLEIIAHLMHYVFAPFPALGYWLTKNALVECCTLGMLTFIGPLDTLGVVHRTAGIFEDVFTIDELDTNIFTAWRYIATDFSLIGPLVLNGLLAGVYVAANMTRAHAIGVAAKAFALFGAFMSLAVTVFVYNSTAFAVLLAIFYSMLVAWRSKPRVQPLVVH